MLEIYKQSFKKSELNTRTIINFSLFITLMGMMALFTVGKISFLDNQLVYDAHQFPSLIYTLCITIIYILLSIIYLYRMKDEIRFHPLILSLFIIFITYRFLSILIYPSYGQSNFSFHPHFDKSLIVKFTYDGCSFNDRIVTFLDDFGFYSYFIIFTFTIKPLSKKTSFLFHIIYAMVEIFALILILYSFIKEWDTICIIFNKMVIHPGKLDDDYVIKSFTSHKNVFGFFLFLATLFALGDFLEHENIPSLILSMLYMLILFLISSRTALFILTILIVLGLGIIYPLINFQKKKAYSIFFLTCFVFLVAIVLIIYFFFRNTSFGKLIDKITDTLFSTHNIKSRNTLTFFAWDMVDLPIFLFGLSKYPFMEIFRLASINGYAKVDTTVLYTSHNSYMDIFMVNGFIGILLLFIILAMVLYIMFKELLNKKNIQIIRYFFLLGGTMIYSLLEPRFIFLEEGTAVFFLLLASTPFVQMKSNSEIK